MNSAFTDLEASLAAREMGAKQSVFPQMIWHGDSFVHGIWSLSFWDKHQYPAPTNYVAAIPWLADDPNEQSALGLLESLGFIIERRRGSERGYWRAERAKLERWAPKSTSIRDLFMACYEKWKVCK